MRRPCFWSTSWEETAQSRLAPPPQTGSRLSGCPPASSQSNWARQLIGQFGFRVLSLGFWALGFKGLQTTLVDRRSITCREQLLLIATSQAQVKTSPHASRGCCQWSHPFDEGFGVKGLGVSIKLRICCQKPSSRE